MNELNYTTMFFKHYQDEVEKVTRILSHGQATPFFVTQYFETKSDEGHEDVVTITSTSTDGSEAAVNMAFERLTDHSQSVVFNAPDSKVCLIQPEILGAATHKKNLTIIQFHKTKLDAPQVIALSRSRSSIVLDRSPITLLEDKLFAIPRRSDEDGIRVMFVEDAPKETNF